MKKSIAVLGLGVFGFTMAKELYRMGNDVLGVDKSPKIIDDIKENVTEALIADVADYDVLLELGIEKFDYIILGMSSNFEGLILTITHLKRLNAKHIIAKAKMKIHEEILYKIGADEVVLVEREMAKKVAEKIHKPNIMDVISIDNELKLITVKLDERFHQKTILELDLRKKYNITALMVKRHGEKASFLSSADFILMEGDELILAGEENSIYKVFSK